MLIEFKCRNFLSFKDEISLNFTTIDSYSEHRKTHAVDSNRKGINLLKSIVVFGSNGGGKSNLTRAMVAMDNLVHNSFSDSLKKKEESFNWKGQFILCQSTRNKPSMFEISILLDQIIYKYGFEVIAGKIINEWLFKTDKREVKLFERTGQDFYINENSFPEGKKFNEVNSNVLFLSYLAQFNGPESSKLFNFFNGFNIVDGLSDNHINHVTTELLKSDDEFKKWLNMALQFLEINSVKVGSDEKSLITKRPVFDDNKIVTEFVDFDVNLSESEGTKKLIYLLGAIYDSLKWGKVFVVDEFDTKLHPNLALKLIRLFHEFNTHGAQFVITAHDSTFLDKEVFRRDQIWFVDRDQFGVSELYPMSNFKAADGLRSMSDFRGKYLNSDFGAAESFEFTKEFISITKNI